ncbi:hypothetical protein V493_04139 [Pseudogymnoascus sp. VKM F-4281 (FW-2241)]|nr:hypothetical protein V493_04139 [Pseudogymnoascus sp. VKM F-4281 (FW-2241)]
MPETGRQSTPYAGLAFHASNDRRTSLGSTLDVADLPTENIRGLNLYDETGTTVVWDDCYQELGSSADFLDIGNFADQGHSNERPSESFTGFLFPLDVGAQPLLAPSTFSSYEDEDGQSLKSLIPVAWLSTLTSPLKNLSPGLSTQNIALSPSFTQTITELQALQYYRTHFPTLAVTKNVLWSTHMVILRHGSQNPMVMHLLLAASLMNLGASQYYDANICSAAQKHSKAGVHMLIDSMNSTAEPDHIDILAACFFLYKYMVEQKIINLHAMTELSRAVCDYIKRHDLDKLCAKSLASSISSIEVTACLRRDKQECLARLLVWIFYEDVAAGVRGSGGFLASHLLAEPEQTREIYQHSTTILESAWGGEYPEHEILDDVENVPILQFLYEVMTIYTEVNEACRLPLLPSDADRIEAKILKLKERSRFLIRLTTITTQPRSRLMINADYMVSYFHALRIYKFRCFHNDGLIATAPPEIQPSLGAILQIAQRSFSAKQQDQMVERFQWPLFIAGIETSDGIHKEWIRSKLKKARLSRALKRILEIQDNTGRRASMPLVRRIMCGDEPNASEHQLLPSVEVDGSMCPGELVGG